MKGIAMTGPALKVGDVLVRPDGTEAVITRLNPATGSEAIKVGRREVFSLGSSITVERDETVNVYRTSSAHPVHRGVPLRRHQPQGRQVVREVRAMTADTTTEVRDWLTEAVALFADTSVRLDLQSKGRPGDPALRKDAKAAKQTLRLTLARAVYEEHPDWEYQRQYREFMAREREALAQASLRLAGDVS